MQIKPMPTNMSSRPSNDIRNMCYLRRVGIHIIKTYDRGCIAGHLASGRYWMQLRLKSYQYRYEPPFRPHACIVQRGCCLTWETKEMRWPLKVVIIGIINTPGHYSWETRITPSNTEEGSKILYPSGSVRNLN